MGMKFDVRAGLIRAVGMTFLFLLLPIFLQTVPSGVLDGALMISWIGQLPFLVYCMMVFVVSLVVFGLKSEGKK